MYYRLVREEVREVEDEEGLGLLNELVGSEDWCGTQLYEKQ